MAEKKTRKGRAQRLAAAIRARQGLVLILVLLLFFAATLIAPDRTWSGREGRSLSARPKPELSSLANGSFAEAEETYFTDQLVLRDLLRAVNFRAERLGGRREKNGIYFGKDGYLLLDPMVPDETVINRVAGSINVFAESNPTVNVYAMVVPDAAVVTKQLLPAFAPIHDQMRDIRLLQNKLGNEVAWLDAAEALSRHTNEEIFYRTDSHWTSRGARYVFDVTATDMGIANPMREYNVHVVSTDFAGDLSVRTGNEDSRDEIAVYTPQQDAVQYYVDMPYLQEQTTSVFHSKALSGQNQYDVFLGGAQPMVDIVTTAGTGRQLVILGDGFARSYVQFLYPYFDQITVVDLSLCKENISTIMRTKDATDVMMLYGADALFADETLSDALQATI